ncbi:MAG: HAD family hydrolase [Pontiellaceae bacterium]|nr:HAD family hydrolase [Pontiellaceae bacterium]
MKKSWCKDDLIHFTPQHEALLAIDSDGCVFDSMTIKQRIFHDGIINFWGLGAVEAEFRRVAEWTALFSPWRGLNRFELLLRIFQNMQNPPDIRSLENFVSSGVPLSESELANVVAATGDPELERALEWSRAVNVEIAAIPEMPVFDGVFQTLEKIRGMADSIVVSQTNEAALVREWAQAGLEKFIDVIAGAELGSKVESLSTAMKGRYSAERTLMVGDAPGDLETARATGALFFPIIPGDETASWIELREQGLDRFLTGAFSPAYQEDLIARFNTALSPVPPWSASRQAAACGCQAASSSLIN